MRTNEKILKYIVKNSPVSGSEIARHFGISRQAVNKHLKVFIETGKIEKEGQTKGAEYFPALKEQSQKKITKYKKAFQVDKITEDNVFAEISMILNLKRNVRKNVYDIIHYIFTEMLNNAIDHSNSKRCQVMVSLDNYNCNIVIRDFGIGLFYSIKDKFQLRDEHEAVGELIKGKTTTMPERHSGEGIFFTSKAADYATYRSDRMNLIFDNMKKDIFLKQEKKIKGTEVQLRISRHSRKYLSKIFSQFAPQDYDYRFEKTKVHVRLFQHEFVSRSEARRLLSGLTKFREIVLDFKGVTVLGQGFADEIFRVFQQNNPQIRIMTENVSPTVRPMIQHVVDNNN